jgi:hypothetical protein
VQTDKLCVGNTCVTELQLQQLLQNQNRSITTSSQPNPTDQNSSNTANASGGVLPIIDITTPIDTETNSNTSITNDSVLNIQTDINTVTPTE